MKQTVHNLLLVFTIFLAISFCSSAGKFTGHGSHSAMKGKLQNGGVQDLDGEEDPDNQLGRDAFVRNKEHIKEHLKDSVGFDPDTATPEELDFHFFQLHDSDGDGRLDGLELLVAVSHGTEDQYDRIERSPEDDAIKQRRIKQLTSRSAMLVDRMLKEGDGDNDGYMTYAEFKNSKTAARQISDKF